MHKPYSESNSFAHGNLNSSLFPTTERLLLFTIETGAHCQNVRRDTYLGECDWVQPYPAPTENTKPTDSSVLKWGVKGIAVQRGTLPANLQVTLVHTPQYWQSQADSSLFGCPGTQDCWVTWNEEEKVPITSRTSSLLLSDLQLLNFSARWEMLRLDFKK